MTTRNFRFSYWILSVVSIAILGAVIVISVKIGTDKRLPFFLADAKIYKEYFFFGLPIGIQLAESLKLSLLALGACAILTSILFMFRKTASSEVYLIALWIALADLESLRLIILLIAQRSTSIGVLVTLTRVVYAARFSGLIAIFISSLYAVGTGHEHPQTGYLLAMLFGSMVAMLMPISIDRFQSSFLLQAGYKSITMIVTFSFLAISFIDYLVAAKQQEESAFVIVGIELTLAGLIWVWLWEQRSFVMSVAAVILLALSALRAIQKLHKLYIWK